MLRCLDQIFLQRSEIFLHICTCPHKKLLWSVMYVHLFVHCLFVRPHEFFSNIQLVCAKYERTIPLVSQNTPSSPCDKYHWFYNSRVTASALPSPFCFLLPSSYGWKCWVLLETGANAEGNFCKPYSKVGGNSKGNFGEPVAHKNS